MLVDPAEEQAITDALIRVLTDPAFADDLRRRGLTRAAQFNWERTSAGTIDVYRRAIV
jgi:glycosyltransferase involved in cell wall biosynthesis